MNYLNIFLIISFIGFAVFGIFSIHTDMQNHNGKCIVAIAQGIDCLKQSNLFSYLIFYFGAYKNFSLAVFSENIINIFLFASAILLFKGLAFSSLYFSKSFQLVLSLYWRRFEHLFCFFKKQQFIHWLALHENSPAAF